MAAEFLSLEQKRMAIERGLSQFLSGDILQRVLQYWESHYGNQPSFVLNRFLNEVCSDYNMREQRKDMLRQVLQEIANVEREQRHQGKAKVQNTAVHSDDLSEAFAYFWQQVMLVVDFNDQAEFDKVILKRIQPYIFVKSLNHLDVYDDELISRIAPKNYAAILTVVYACYCEFYGPTKADQVYARVKNSVKQLYDGVDMHQLL